MPSSLCHMQSAAIVVWIAYEPVDAGEIFKEADEA
jgi:hypothetical protein